LSIDVHTFEVDEWLQRGRQIAEHASSTCWQIGDWLNDGERKWGETYRWASEITGLSQGTLRNYAVVARAFELSRRNDNLSFTHHALVSAIPMEAAIEWLDLAQQEQWSARELNAALKEVQQLPPGRPEIVATIFKVTVPHDHEERWRVAATARGLEVEAWLVAVADEAAADAARAAA
jgi:preprotein translocase subunit Sec63